jgi:hypothetical protein
VTILAVAPMAATPLAVTLGATGAGARPMASSTAAQASTEFAGYQVAKPSTHVHSAAVTFKVPSITCKKNLSGVGPAVIVQSTVNKKKNSFTFSGGGIGVACEHKTPEFVALIVINGDTINDHTVPVAAGDSITVVMTMVAAKTKVTLTDHTSKSADTKTGKGAIGALAQVGNRVLAQGRDLQLDPFSKTTYTGVEINGKSLKAEKAVRVTWKRGRKVLVSAGPLTKGKDFSDTFKAS